MVLGVQEGQVNVACGLDTVIAIAGTLAVLHLRCIGVGTDVGVAFPAVYSCLIASSVSAVGVLKIDVDEISTSSIAIQVVKSWGQRSEVTERGQILVVTQ